MTNTLGINIDMSGFIKTAEWLEKYAKNVLPKKVQELLELMTQKGEEIAKLNLKHIDTGETFNSIVGYRKGNEGYIVAGGNAVWIEFGTGVYAPGQTDHPKLDEVPGIVRHGEWNGRHGANPNGWFYPNENGNFEYNGKRYSHTMGIASNPFMYEASKFIRENCPQMAKEIFSK